MWNVWVKFFGVLLFGSMLLLLSCLKESYDGPPDSHSFDPDLKVTNSIAQLSRMTSGKAIEADVVITGIVVLNDKHNNCFKKIIMQDSTGGIEVLIDQSGLYNDFPVGRKVYVKCNGLFVSNENGNPQIGFLPDGSGFVSGIPGTLMNDYIVKANYPNVLTPVVLSIDQLSDTSINRYLNTLVSFQNVEFSDSSKAIPYAQPSSQVSSTALDITDCSGRLIKLRTTAYASFQPYLTPKGNGSITGILNKYKDNYQIYIRDTNDLAFYNPPCIESGSQILFKEDFAALANNSEVVLAGWNNFSELGERKYTKGAFQGDIYAKISAYGAGATPPIVKTWLITPAINLAGRSNVKLIFKTKDGFDNGATFKVYVATDYSGIGNPVAANWSELNAPVSAGSTNGYAANWTVANVSLAETQVVHIAFKYEGGTGKTTTYELGYIQVIAE